MNNRFAPIKSSDFLESVIESLPGYVYRVRNDHRWSPVYISDNIKKITGYSVEDFARSEGRLYDQLIHPDDRNRVWNHVSECLATGKSFQIEYRIVSNDKQIRWVWEQAKGIFNELGELEFLEGYVSDISERKRIELELQNAHNELTAIFDSGPVSIVKTDAQGVITHWNKGAERLLQYSADEMIGKMNPGIFHDPVEFAERARKHEIDLDPSNLFEAFKQLALLGEFDSKEWKHIRKDGVPIPVQVVVTPTIDDQGYVSGFVGIAIDITESKSAQEKSKTLLKITTEQNKRLKNFAHIVSHNLRSHSGNFLMMLDLIDDMHPQLKDDEIIQNIRLAANDLQKTINHLNEVVLLSASGEIGMVRVGLQSHIASAIQNVAFLAKDTGVEIINNVPNAIGIKGIPAYIDSILINFISNAIKYSDPEKRSFVRLHTELKDNHVLLKIEDNGLGINLKANKDRIFGMFKTFHDNTDSRGLGLFMARNQIEALGGDVSVESEVGVGTTFTIHLQSA